MLFGFGFSVRQSLSARFLAKAGPANATGPTGAVDAGSHHDHAPVRQLQPAAIDSDFDDAALKRLRLAAVPESLTA